MKTKTGSRVGLRHAAFTLLVAYGSRIAWWNSEFDPLMLLGYAIIVLGMIAMFTLFNEVAEAREKELAQEIEEDAETPPSNGGRRQEEAST